MKELFIDTSGWLAILVNSDRHHENAVEMYWRLLAVGRDLVTHDGILVELGNALANVKSRNMALQLRAVLKIHHKTEQIYSNAEAGDDKMEELKKIDL